MNDWRAILKFVCLSYFQLFVFRGICIWNTSANLFTERRRILSRVPSSARDWTAATPYSMEFLSPTSIAFSVCRTHWFVSCAQRRYRSPAIHLRQSLHWLPIRQVIMHKIAMLTCKVRQPTYLADLIVDYSPSRSTRSQGKDLLIVPRCKTQTISRAFRVAATSI